MDLAVRVRARCARQWRKRLAGICWDSGAIYRVLALAALHHHVDVESEEALVPLAAHLDVRLFLLTATWSGAGRRGCQRRDPYPGSGQYRLLRVAAFPRVREALLRRQRAFRELPGLIADGAIWAPSCSRMRRLKFSLDASAEERPAPPATVAGEGF